MICVWVPVTAVNWLDKFPIVWAVLFNVTAVLFVLVWKRVNEPEPIDDPLFTVKVPFPRNVFPVKEFPVPDIIRFPAACLIKPPEPDAFPEKVIDPAAPFASILESAFITREPGHTIAPPLNISMDGFVVWLGFKCTKLW